MLVDLLVDFLVDLERLDLQLFRNSADVLPGLFLVVEGEAGGGYLVVVLVDVIDKVVVTDVEFLALEWQGTGGGAGAGGGVGGGV